MTHGSALTLDADWDATTGWEISYRFGAESMEAGFTDVSDEDLPSIVGTIAAELLIAERDLHKKATVL